MNREQMEQLKQEYPSAEVEEYSPGHFRVQARYDQEKKCYYCMTCGSEMVDRMNQYVKNGEWVPLKRPNNISCQVCPKCDEFRCQPIAVGFAMSAKDLFGPNLLKSLLGGGADE